MKTKIFKTNPIVKRITLALLFTLPSASFSQVYIPKPVEHLYSSQKDMNISDDFNSIEWGKKWTWRVTEGRKLGDSTYVKIKTENETYVSLTGNSVEKIGSGISSLHSTGYGFYVSRWRIKGVKEGQRTPWHPSIWSTRCNYGKDYRVLDPKPTKNIEIDFMESFVHPNWGAHVNVWNKKSAVTFELLPKRSDYSYPDWNTFGFEYTPEYVAVWEYKEDEWKFIKSIRFSSEVNEEDAKIINGWRPNKGSTINYEHRQKMYWILSNIYMKEHDMPSDDVELHIDYFYYYPFTFYPSCDCKK